MSALTLSPGRLAGKHLRTDVPDTTVINPAWQGAGVLGLYNATLRQLPPQKPCAVLEQGVGRTPGVTDWERREHWIHDNPDWYLGVGALFQPADMSIGGAGGGPGLQTPVPVQTLLALRYIQNREAQTTPGSSSQRTVPLPRAQTNTATAVLI